MAVQVARIISQSCQWKKRQESPCERTSILPSQKMKTPSHHHTPQVTHGHQGSSNYTLYCSDKRRKGTNRQKLKTVPNLMEKALLLQGIFKNLNLGASYFSWTIRYYLLPMLLTGKAEWATILCKKNRPGLQTSAARGSTNQGTTEETLRQIHRLRTIASPHR